LLAAVYYVKNDLINIKKILFNMTKQEKNSGHQHLWAPWRLEYVQAVNRQGCFICDIIKDDKADRENLVVNRSAETILIINKYPYNNGHLMVAPYRHIHQIQVMTDSEHLELMKHASWACQLLRNVINAEGFNIGMNIGAVAGAGLKEHLHLHIVPRWEGDTNFMPVLADIKVIPQHLDALWVALSKQAKAYPFNSKE
jgi:ATP adenylyltransferase